MTSPKIQAGVGEQKSQIIPIGSQNYPKVGICFDSERGGNFLFVLENVRPGSGGHF